MKKVYLSLLTVAMCSAGVAQNNANMSDIQPLRKKADISIGLNTVDKAVTTLNEKATVLWSNSFGTPSDWTLTNTSVPSLDWSFETDAAAIPVAALAPAAFTTVGDGFLFISSDGVAGNADLDGTPVIVEATTATPIDLTGNPYVNLSFENNYRWWQESREVRVSGDNGSTWTTFEVTNTTGPDEQNSGNPLVSSFDISAVAGGQSQVLIQFVYNDNDYWGWYWAVDDVQITVTEDHDLKLNGTTFGSIGSWGPELGYGLVPTTQIAPVQFTGMIENVGVQNQTNIDFTANVNAGTFIGSSVGMESDTSFAFTVDTLVTTTSYTPAASLGMHEFAMSISADSVDVNPGDNSDSASFEVVEYLYARDMNNPESGTYNSGNAYEVGNIFDIYATQDMYSITVKVAASSEGTPVIYAKLYSIDGGTGDFIFMETTADYSVTADDITNAATISLPLFSPQTLTAGEPYLVVVGAYGDGGATSDFVTTTSGISKDQTTYYFDGTDATWYYTSSTPMVRINFDPASGIENNEASALELGQNIPNPFGNNTTINYSVNSTDEVSFKVVDMTGKVVMNINEGVRTAGSYSININAGDLAEGMYFYTLSNGTTSLTKSMTITK